MLLYSFATIVVLVFFLRFLAWQFRAGKRRRIDYRQRISLRKLPNYQIGAGKVVAILPLRGPILDQEMPIPSVVTFAECFRRELQTLAETDGVDAVVVEIDTPGGTVTASALIAEAIADCSIPIFAYVRGMAASGGLWALCGFHHDKVFAHPQAVIGSLGVRGPTVLSYTKLQATGGILGGTIASEITGRVHSAGLGKAYGDAHASDEEKTAGSTQIDDLLCDVYENFIAVVSRARKIRPEVLRALGAEVVVASRARDLGLVSELATQASFERHIRAYLGNQHVSYFVVGSEEGGIPDILRSLRERRVPKSAHDTTSVASVLSHETVRVIHEPTGIVDSTLPTQ